MPKSKDKNETAAPSRMVVDFESLKHVGGGNFRDLGGYKTRDGGVVRSRTIYRSAHLADVPEESPLRRVALRTLVTLQSRMEVAVLGPPALELFGSVRWEHIPMGDRWIVEGLPKPAPGHEHLVLVTSLREDWRAFFKLLAQAELYPMLFHCSAGRDRTGVGAAMLLEMLGVSREDIVADFLESNATFPRIPLEPAQLNPVFELIDRHGGIHSFMRQSIGIDSTEMGAIRAHLLADNEPVSEG